MSDDLSTAPVPDLARLAKLSVSERDDGSIELSGPPAAVLSLARWLRAPTSDPVAVEGDLRPGAAGAITVLAIEVGPSPVRVAVTDARLAIGGAAADLVDLAEQVETVGVGALDVRWAPVERRATIEVTGRTLVVASAYPLEP